MKIKLLAVGPLLTNCYFVISEAELQSRTSGSLWGELLIIDPGGDVKNILREISQTKAKPKYILNTHYHWDHIFGNKIIKEVTGAKILIHEAEKDFLKEADRFLKDSDEIKIGDSIFKILHTPGHTRGSICLLNKNSLFTGDTLFKPSSRSSTRLSERKPDIAERVELSLLGNDGYGRTDLPGGSEKDLEKSLRKLKKILKPGMTIYPGHGEIFKISGM